MSPRRMLVTTSQVCPSSYIPGWVTASRAKVSLTLRLGKSAPGDGGNGREVVAGAQLGGQPGAKADVLVVLVNVDELAQPAVGVVDPLPETRVLGLQRLQRLLHGDARDFDHGLTGGEAAQRPRDTDFDGHEWSP